MKHNDFWQNKVTLITGGMGFVGSWIAATISSKGGKVIVVDHNIQKKPGLDIMEVENQVMFLQCDITNYQFVSGIFATYEPDFVFHLAGKAIIEDCVLNPLPSFESNIKGTWNLLEACRVKGSVKGIVVASSYKVYGNQSTSCYSETSPLLGILPYDAAKICVEVLSRSYYAGFGLPIAVTRCANTYGGGDLNLSRIIPEAIHSFLNGKELVIRSDGAPQRDYLYIEDAVAGYIAIAENLHREDIKGQAFNLGSGKSISVLELARKIGTIVGKDVNITVLKEAQNIIDDQYLDIGKAVNFLDWQPRYTLEEGLKESVGWYKEYFGKSIDCIWFK